MAMTNEEITNEFETLFGEETDEEIKETPTEEETPEEEEEHEEEEKSEEEEESEEESEEEKPEETPEDKKKAKQNYAFAQQRQQIRAQEQFIKNLGKLIGMDNAKPEEIQNKVQEVLLAKQSKEQNIPVEILQRLEKAEAIVQENQEIKLQNQVQNAFTDLVEKHSLEPEQVEEFTQYLIENDKNPMEHPEVDIAAEYLKLHYDDMVKAAVDAALNKEKERKDKVNGKAASPTPGGGNEPGEAKIESVADLDRLFGSMDL
jgi:hypothetical protein